MLPIGQLGGGRMNICVSVHVQPQGIPERKKRSTNPVLFGYSFCNTVLMLPGSAQDIKYAFGDIFLKRNMGHCSSQTVISFFIFVFHRAAGLVITTPPGTLVSPTSSQSFVSGHPATTMIVSALHSSGETFTQYLLCNVVSENDLRLFPVVLFSK